MSSGPPQSPGYLPPGPTFAPPPGYPPAAPTGYPLSEPELRQLPPPVLPWPGPRASMAQAADPQRPGVVGLACNLAVTASLLWICGLSLAWVTATAGADQLARQGETGPVFHILHRFHDRMLDGLAWPFYLFPLASTVTGFLLLSRRRWTRIAHTAVGLGALIWSAWLLSANLIWWASSAFYIAIACLILWTPGASRWYARR